MVSDHWGSAIADWNPGLDQLSEMLLPRSNFEVRFLNATTYHIHLAKVRRGIYTLSNQTI